jgi:hypothetical protein
MNMNDPSGQPYARDRMVDKPGIMGARWWHASLADQDAQVARRTAIRNILIAGGVIAGFGALLAMCVGVASSGSSSGTTGAAGTLPSDMADSRKTSLEMQKEYGWAFGAVTESLVFDGVTTKPFQPGALQALSTDLAPTSPALRPFFQSTLFESSFAVPRSLGKLDPDEAAVGFTQLSTEVKPISTPGMDAAYARGRSMASIFTSLGEAGGSPAGARLLR